MEFTWLISLLIFFLIMLTLIKFSKSHKNASRKIKLPPGPPTLPIIGNLHQLAAKNSTPPHHLFAELARVYGPLMHLRLGEVPTIIVSSADMAKEVMRTHDAGFCNRPSMLAGELIFYDQSNIALAPYGEYWRQVRKIATLELFTAKRIQSFRPIREEEVANLVKSIAMEEGSAVNLSNKLFGLAFDITSRLAFSKKGKEQEEFRAHVMDTTELLSGFSICDLYPSIKFLPSTTGMRKRLQDMVKRSDKILDSIIGDHLFEERQQGEGEDYKDLVDVLLTFHKGDGSSSSQGGPFSLTMKNIKAIVLETFMAGSETSSTTMEWAMSELLKNPKVMEKVQNEIREVLTSEGKETIDETSLNNLKYLKQVIKETLRLHPPVPFLVPRESMEQCEIQGYEIPSKARIFVNAWAIGRDINYWTDPECFYPERFDNSAVDYRGNHFELIPFGAGRRMCPGLGQGTTNVELSLASLLYHFNWMLPDEIRSQDLNMDESIGITARRKHDLLVIPSIHPCSPLKRM